MGTWAELQADVEAYTTYDDATFLSYIPTFTRSAEERIFYFIQLPNFRKNVTGNFTADNQYLQLPTDFLAPSSLAVISAAGVYTYLLNKDVNYIREVYPDPASTGEPRDYALFDATSTAGAGETTILVGPTPDLAYDTELNYFYKPASLAEGDVDGNTTWLSINAYDTLLYGVLVEASNYLKRNSGIDNMGDKYEERFMIGLQGLKNLGETRDRKDTYRSGEKRKPE